MGDGCCGGWQCTCEWQRSRRGSRLGAHSRCLLGIVRIGAVARPAGLDLLSIARAQRIRAPAEKSPSGKTAKAKRTCQGTMMVVAPQAAYRIRAQVAPKFGLRLPGSLCSNSEEGGVDVPPIPTPFGMSAVQISMLARAGSTAAQIADAAGMSQSPVPSRCTKVTRQTLSPRRSKATMLPRWLFPSPQKPSDPQSSVTFAASCSAVVAGRAVSPSSDISLGHANQPSDVSASYMYRLSNHPAPARYLSAPKVACKAFRGQAMELTHGDSHHLVQSIDPRERLQEFTKTTPYTQPCCSSGYAWSNRTLRLLV